MLGLLDSEALQETELPPHINRDWSLYLLTLLELLVRSAYATMEESYPFLFRTPESV